MVNSIPGCRAVTQLRSGGQLTEDFTNKVLNPASENLLCAGEAPTMAWMQFPTLHRRPLKGKSEALDSDSMITSALQKATQWAAQGIVGIANAIDGVQGTVIPCSADTTWVIVGVHPRYLIILKMCAW